MRISFVVAALVLPLLAGETLAGPCTTGATTTTKTNDAGSDPTPGAAANAPQPQRRAAAIADTATGANPEQSGTKLMNDAVGGKATSSEDAQKQMQGQPTAAEQAAGEKPDC
jgi:hypothetical protein